MSIGSAPSKLDSDTAVGDISRALFFQFRRAKNYKYWLDGRLDSDLTAMGYSAPEIAQLRSVALALDNMRQVWEGLLAITPAADQRTFPRLASGLGDV